MLVEYVPDEAERRSIEPSLLSLLGVGEAPAGGREELFASLRTLFERISIQGTTALVFEDLQWADPGVLDFIDHLAEWSIGYPILVVSIARPDLLDRRPDWGAGRRDLVALVLGPLAEGPMRDLIVGLVPDMPAATVSAILERADGIPLYAVEMVRMLVADGRLEEGDGAYRVVGDLGELRIPDTLQSLIASRLDALEPADRALLQDGAVLGQTFGVAALASLTGEPPETLEPRLRALVRREVLRLDTDPRSPERGQFGFTQALVREVAYATLAKRDRRAKHLAAARYYETLEDEEVAGVLATHYVDAWAAAPGGPEGDAVAAQARIALRAAADRAANLGAVESAIALFRRALDVTTDEAEVADLVERIGTHERRMGHYEAAERSLRDAIERYGALGDLLGRARATIDLALVVAKTGDGEAGLAMLRAVESDVADLAPHPVLVRLWIAVAGLPVDVHAALEVVDRGLRDGERLGIRPEIAEAMGLKGMLLGLAGRPLEGRALLEAAARMAVDDGAWVAATATTFRLALGLIESDPRGSLAVGLRAVELTRRYGMGALRITALGNLTEAAIWVGDWAPIEAELAAVQFEALEAADRAALLVGRSMLDAFRGRDTSASVAEILAFSEASTDPNILSASANGIALVRFAEGRWDDAFRIGLTTEIDELNAPGGLTTAVRAAVRARDLGRAHEALGKLMRIEAQGTFTSVNRAALTAAVAGLEGRWPEAAAGFRDAWRHYRDLGTFVALALSQLDALTVGPPDDPMLESAAEEARAVLTLEGAAAFLVQLQALEAERSSAAAAGAPRAATEVAVS
jgi:tetratricopeptide (TPR) repeat protein